MWQVRQSVRKGNLIMTPMKKQLGFVTIILFSMFWLFQNFSWPGRDAYPGSGTCSNSKLSEILEPAAPGKKLVKVDCSFTLNAGHEVTKTLDLRGASAAGVSIRCNGATLKPNAGNPDANRILIRSERTHQNKDAVIAALDTWGRPEKVLIEGCKIEGAIRVAGLGSNGEAVDVRESSRYDTNHTARAQAVAPSNLYFDSIEVKSNGPIPIYLGPGVTNTTLVNSRILGQSNSVAIYLDAESAHNTLQGNHIEVKTTREALALDGSAENLITKNVFKSEDRPSIYLYRNCGEGGTVRHQSPHGNQIQNNTFHQNARESIHVGSREGHRLYCDFDKGFPFGSSVNDRDLATDNEITGNRFIANLQHANFTSRFIIISSYATTRIGNNRLQIDATADREFTARVHGPFVDLGGNTAERLSLPSQNMQFDCSTTSSNAGCDRLVSCGTGRTIRSIKAACNLEYGSVSWDEVKKQSDNTLQVDRASDHVGEGACSVDNTIIHQGTASLKNMIGANQVRVRCREHDKNGGDCEIKGIILCGSN